MAPRPIFTATHPRACSTAFERVFMTRRDVMDSFHEPFGDAFYYGPEFMSDRYRNDVATRQGSGFSGTTYKSVLDSFAQTENQGKRVFIKDMAYYLFSPDQKPTEIAPSLGGDHHQEKGNPTVIPLDVLRKFHFTFLIRHPRRSIPSYWRCCIPPLSDKHGFEVFMPNEAGYEELVRFFNFLLDNDIVDKEHLTVVDADDLLDSPENTIRQFCERTGIDFQPEMLVWTEDDRAYATERFAKWDGFHDDALKASKLEARTHAQKALTEESENEEWTQKYGAEAQKIIRTTVDANVPYYDYLKQFALGP